MQNICRAVDAAVLQSGGVIEIARAAKIDRVTLYRAFRLERGPTLDNMIKVLRVLGFRLIVELRCKLASSHEELPKVGWSAGRKRAAVSARRFTAAFKSGRNDELAEVFKQTFASKKTLRSLWAKRLGRARRFIAFLHKIPCRDSERS